MATTGGSISFSSFPSFSRRAKPNSTLVHADSLELRHIKMCKCSNVLPSMEYPQVVCRLVPSPRNIACFAAQESSSLTVAAETKEKKESETAEETAPAKPKPKPAAKAPAKSLPQMMEEDVIPSLKAILEAQDDISELELSFNDDKLEGSFSKKGNPYSFWAFFPDGLAGAKGFSLSSYGSGPSTVEPFLVDEKKITAKHVVFWVEKRLAAQGIIPVWNE
ncbi:uncharacterized protein LOC107781661 [Nicotiana tabacum]|uniref:Uncharacterized protein LOC107781661 n=1 Tax=Nicotiana tabacum TaxID=4097 RepID=A0A1S3Z0H0_TOBAC|nr:uncharacterized protein LOC104103875 isoform X1 [Nicotiana tomentosiformis]XP_016457883.1 PREDICTED: uncharacterized protein LOC107781661 [Nicotiana tabacum]